MMAQNTETLFLLIILAAMKSERLINLTVLTQVKVNSWLVILLAGKVIFTVLYIKVIFFGYEKLI